MEKQINYRGIKLVSREERGPRGGAHRIYQAARESNESDRVVSL